MTLSARNIRVALAGHMVLDDVSLDLAAGDLLGLVGPNGAGKTTLLRALAGLAQPAGGDVTLDGAPLDSVPAAQRGRLIAYLAQSGQIHWPLRVERLVALGRLPHLSPWRGAAIADKAAIDKALHACELDGFRTRSVASLSGGERARALLARALAVEPDYLLADEPAAGLDPWHELNLMDLLRERAAHGMAVVVVLHDLALALRYCTRVCLLQHGRVVALGQPAEVLSPTRLAEVYGVAATLGELGGQPVLAMRRLA